MKNKSKIALICSILLSASLLGGCIGDSDSDSDIESNGSNNNKSVMIGDSLSVAEIKNKYSSNVNGESESGSSDLTKSDKNKIMPLYNVEKDEEFSFEFNFEFDSGTLSRDILTVHTDKKALDESAIYHLSNNFYDFKTGKTTVSVSPSTGILTNSKHFSEGPTWGNAPIYYLRINYDLDADKPVKLDEPIIIPFTVKSDVEIPTLKYDIDSKGQLKLKWDKVEGADSYNVYNIASFGNLLGDDNANSELGNAENGYKKVTSPLVLANVSGTELDDFLNTGFAKLLGDTNGINSYQNQGVSGNYYVTAVKDGKESNFSNAVETFKILTQLPKEFTSESNLLYKKFDTEKDLPQKVDVLLINGDVISKNVVYEKTDNANKFKYSVEGTVLEGFVEVKNSTGKLPEPTEKESGGNVEPENDTTAAPTDLPTIIDDSKDKSKDEPKAKDKAKEETKDEAKEETKDEAKDESKDESNLIEKQKENTESHVKEANKEDVEIPDVLKEVPLNASNALEEYLALKLINGDTDISLQAFPEAQDINYIIDVLFEVYYQNPLILGLSSYSYDYATLTLKVTYKEDKDTIHKKQEEIIKEANKIVSKIITKGMSDEEKRKVIYDYLNDNTNYDDDALKEAEANNFIVDNPKFVDSFTAYGIMVNKVGVCASYAGVYHILAELAGIESIVVTGDINGVPHAWNKVKIDSEWLHVDSTNNETNSGIPYLYFQLGDETAKKNGLNLNKEYWLDSEIEQFKGTTDKYDYYSQNNLVLSDIKSLATSLEKNLKGGKEIFTARLSFKPTNNELNDSLGEIVTRVAPDKLNNTRYGLSNDYFFLTTNPKTE